MKFLWRTVVLAVLAIALQSVPAHAAFPGQNGKIVFSAKLGGDPNFHLYTVNPDGTGQTQITFGAFNDTEPEWSPDGAKIAFASNRTSPEPGVYVVNADGSGLQRISTPSGSADAPTWSPDATSIAYVRFGGQIWSVDTDGSDLHQVTPPSSGECPYSYFWPRWSPDGGYIAVTYTYNCITEGGGHDLVGLDGTFHASIGGCTGPYDWAPDAQKLISSDCGDTWTRSRDGDYLDYYTFSLGSGVVWSPDGERLLLAWWTYNTGFRLFTMKFDETDHQEIAFVPNDPQVTSFAGFDWQPILKGYPRPKAAGATYLPLVPAYDACTTPNSVHAPPLSHPSCNPPQRTSTALTLGSPDANGQVARSTAYLKLGVNATTGEIGLNSDITDVRNASDLADYTGALELRFTTRITDKSNTPYPGGPGPGTTQDFAYSLQVPCTATDPGGSTCSLHTTANAVAPGTSILNRRAIWDVGAVEARDGAGDVFLRQGVFVP